MQRAGNSKNAFTLIEISVVLVIIGLLLGGVMVGQSMLNNSRLNSVLMDVNRYRAAINAFEDKYDALPGDFTRATNHWGTDATSCASAVESNSLQKATCNGNGDGRIRMFQNANNDQEGWRAWQHLANAGMIEGTFSGRSYDTSASFNLRTLFISEAFASPSLNYAARGGINIPRARYETGAFFLAYIGRVSDALGPADNNFFESGYKHALFFGSTNDNKATFTPIITAEEAMKLDSKSDDGKPATGIISTWASGGTHTPACATTASMATAAYNVSNKDIVCSLIFKVE